MNQSRARGAAYLIVAGIAGIPGVVLVGAVVLINVALEDEVCHGVYWCDYNAYGLVGIGLLSIALWLGERGRRQWRGDA